jgi:hypothetical protein
LLGAFTFMPRTNVVIAGRPAEGATAILADGTLFDVMRQPVAVRRGLTAADDRPDAPLAVVISYDFWQRVFAGASTALDQAVTVNGLPARIVGLTARGFPGMSPGGFRPVTDITLPRRCSRSSCRGGRRAADRSLRIHVRCGCGRSCASPKEASARSNRWRRRRSAPTSSRRDQ